MLRCSVSQLKDADFGRLQPDGAVVVWAREAHALTPSCLLDGALSATLICGALIWQGEVNRGRSIRHLSTTHK